MNISQQFVEDLLNAELELFWNRHSPPATDLSLDESMEYLQQKGYLPRFLNQALATGDKITREAAGSYRLWVIDSHGYLSAGEFPTLLAAIRDSLEFTVTRLRAGRTEPRIVTPPETFLRDLLQLDREAFAQKYTARPADLTLPAVLAQAREGQGLSRFLNNQDLAVPWSISKEAGGIYRLWKIDWKERRYVALEDYRSLEAAVDALLTAACTW